jgi:lipid-A-disaccharide synthase
MISAGEASGDRLGAGLARALRAVEPDIELIGMGGPQMAAAGVRLLQDSHEVAVVGITEVLARLPQIWRAMGRLERALDEHRPDVLVPIDFPDFNLRLSQRAKRRKIPVVYFVSPQVWAWRSGRVKTIRERVDEMLVLFKFESIFYRDADLPVTWVGHPFAEPLPQWASQQSLRERYQFAPDDEIVALMPGSRAGEIGRLLPILLGAAERLREKRPKLKFLMPLAAHAPIEMMREQVAVSAVPDIEMIEGRFPEILSICSAGIVASGTASLECAAQVGLPIVVVYRIQPLTYAIGKRMIQVDHIALPNLVMGRRVVPELVQDDCNPQRIAIEVERYLEDPDHAEKTRGELAKVRARLGEPGIYGRAAERVLARAKSS